VYVDFSEVLCNISIVDILCFLLVLNIACEVMKYTIDLTVWDGVKAKSEFLSHVFHKLETKRNVKLLIVLLMTLRIIPCQNNVKTLTLALLRSSFVKINLKRAYKIVKFL